MFQHLEQLSPETLRVYAACLEHRRRFGEWPSTRQVVALATSECASVGAALVLTRYELLAADGRVVPLGDSDTPPAIVHDAQTIRAILARGLPAAELRSPQGKRMLKSKLSSWASAWELVPRP